MKNSISFTAAKAVLLFAFVFVLTNLSFAQSEVKKDTAVNASPTTQTVSAQQSGPWTVGIDQTRNTVQLVNNGPVRKPFQARIIADVAIGGVSGNAVFPIPAGKRLVIENISAIARTPDGTKMQIQLFSYFDNNGDGVGDISDISFHRIALSEQGTFSGYATSTANHKVLIFADEQIGPGHYGVSLEVRLNTPATGFVQGQVTMTGYLEDLPAVP